MRKLGIFVGEDNWTFFNDIYDELKVRNSTRVFRQRNLEVPMFAGRLNKHAFRRDVERLLRWSDVCFFEWASDLLAFASHLPKSCAIVTRLHSFELFDWAPKVNWRNVDCVILVSNAMEDMFCELYPDHSHKTVVVYNGCSLGRFQPLEQKAFQNALGMLCNIVPVKRVYEAVLMMDSLRSVGYTPVLRIAGEPRGDLRYWNAIVRLVDTLDLRSQEVFDGFVEDTVSWFKDCDIFISNSFWEGQQVALIEAMASGCYCLSHHWRGADEVLPPENLYLSESELVEKLISYARAPDSERLIRMEQMRTLAFQRFDIVQTRNRIAAIVAEVAAR